MTSETSKSISPLAFQGRWIGETQGCETPAHLWEIAVLGSQVTIKCCWEGELSTGALHGTLAPDEPAFTIADCKATLIDAEHFVIEGWVGQHMGDRDVPGGAPYNVAFARPGLAELTNASAYRRWLQSEVYHT